MLALHQTQTNKIPHAQVLDDTVNKFTAKLETSSQAVKEGEQKLAELEEEVQRLTGRCKELVQQKELTGEVIIAINVPFVPSKELRPPWLATSYIFSCVSIQIALGKSLPRTIRSNFAF